MTAFFSNLFANEPDCRLLWVISVDGQKGEHLPWGKSIRIGA